MNPELEELLKAFDAFQEATDANGKQLRAIYYSHLADCATRTGRPVETIDKLIRYKHGPWKLAQKRPSTLPPKA
jgi:hypothetical protein